MARFNIIGHGFLDIADPTGVAWKAQNPQFRFADISLGRSTEFSVPATDHNRQMLGFAEDPAVTGDMLRQTFACQMVYDGGMVMGTLAVTSYNNKAFTCVFTIGNATWIDALQDLKLADCVTSFNKGVLWSDLTAVTDADVVDPTTPIQIVKYDNGISASPNWQLVPSVNVKAYIEDILTNIGIPYSIGVDQKYWMIAGSMQGGGVDNVTFTQTALNDFSLIQSQNYFHTININMEWAESYLFGAYVGGGTTVSTAFVADENVKITFPSSMPNDVFLIRWSPKLKHCETIGGKPLTDWDEFSPLDGQTLTIYKGDMFFFASKQALGYVFTTEYFGFKSTDIPFLSVSVTVDRAAELSLGEVWQMRVNHPDMTVFEFLKSVSVSLGLELFVDGQTGVHIAQGSYGTEKDFVALNRVISIDTVTRRVEAWGSGTRNAAVGFDSEDYVTEPIGADYVITNEQLQEPKKVTSKFSEGAVGDYGVLVKDVDASTTPYKFVGKRWTLAQATSGSTYLQRVEAPEAVGYIDIADNSTAMTVKVAATEADFYTLKPSTTFLWRGSAFVWTDASWSAGVLSLTLQRVSQAQADASPTPPPALVSIEAQFSQGGAVVVGTDDLDTLKQYLIVKATYSDSSTRVLSDNEYTLSGTLAYPSATITVDYQGETDTFTVAVAYDAQVAYLESTGTQYIDTGVAASTTASYEVECSFETNSNQFMCAIRRTSSYYDRSCFGVYNGDITLYYGRASSNSWSPQAHDTAFHNYKQIVDASSATVEFDGVQHSFTRQNYSLGVTYYLFRRNSNEAALQQYCSSKVRLAKFYNSSGSLVLNLIPVRCGTVGYMYDRVSGTLFGNDGTGDFVVGADV